MKIIPFLLSPNIHLFSFLNPSKRVALPLSMTPGGFKIYAINGGRDEKSGVQVGPQLAPLTGEYLNYAFYR